MALTDKLTDIADAIRAKTGESAPLSLTDMPTAIASITGGGTELPASVFVVSGNGDYLFAENHFGYLLEHYGPQWDIDLTSAKNCFQNVSVPIMSNLDINVSGDCGMILYGYSGSDIPPYINGTEITSLSSGLATSSIITIPNDWFAHLQFKDNALSINLSGCLGQMNHLRGIINLQTKKASNFYTQTGKSNYSFPGQLYGQTQLDGIINLPVISTTNSSMNSYTNGLNYCYFLKRLTYSTDNGTPFVARIANMTLDLSQNGPGYFPASSYILNEDGSLKENLIDNSILRGFKNYTPAQVKTYQIYDVDSYNRLKNEPLRFSTKIEYATYDKAAALETIQSLPDVSAFGTNIIKFKGAAGSLTDSGAINTLTAAEQAIATNKGWTIQFV